MLCSGESCGAHPRHPGQLPELKGASRCWGRTHLSAEMSRSHAEACMISAHDFQRPLFTIEAYLALERTAEERHEYLDGQVYAMAGESPDHGTICTNLTVHLGLQLIGSSCRAFSKDTK